MSINGPDQGVPIKGPENKEGLNLRILIADDQEIVSNTARAVLKRAGHRVDVVKSAPLLLDKIIAGEKYDLIITDNHMPEMSGIEVLRIIREIYADLHLPVIVYSGASNKEEIETIRSLKAEFLQKPFSVQKLKEVVKQAIENKP